MKIIKTFLIFVLSLTFTITLIAQNKEKKPNQYFAEETFSELDILSKYYKKSMTESGSKSFLDGFAGSSDLSKMIDKSGALIPIDGFIDPEKYYVGPSDVLEINIWGAIPVTLPVIISPEGLAIINMVAEVNVKDLSLAEAKIRITNEIKKKFKSSSVSVTLKAPRIFNVSVVGNVTTPGSYIVSAFDRVDKVVSLAVKKLKQEELPKAEEMNKLSYFRDKPEEERKDYSLRNIKIFRKTGDTINIDLIRFFSMGDNGANPYLRDGDVVFVPKEDIEGNYISVYGSVKQPGKYEYAKGDNITTAIKIAQGITENSDLSQLEIHRVNEDWSGYTTSFINFSEIQSGKASDVVLNPGDRIFVRPLKSVRPLKEVTLKGEIFREGKYPITPGVTKLSEVIKNAGGFTPYASLAEAKIVRKTGDDDLLSGNPDYERLSTLRLGKLDRTDIEYFTVEEAIKRGFVVADFKKIFLEKNNTYDIILHGDEIIYVPTNINSVYVYGQVNNPGYVTIQDSKDYEYYINRAGGFGESAVKGDVAIIKGGSKEWKDPDDTKIESGDIIWVPKKSYRDFTGWWEIVKDVSSFIVSAGTLALIIIQIQNSK